MFLAADDEVVEVRAGFWDGLGSLPSYPFKVLWFNPLFFLRHYKIMDGKIIASVFHSMRRKTSFGAISNG